MIKFPKVHIAASVLNRILDVRDELERSSKADTGAGGGPLPVPPPVVTDPAPLGAVLDVKANTPPPADVPPLETQEPAADELAGLLARGDNLIS